MKRYLLFQFDEYYPCGGWDDFRGSFDSIEEATAAIDIHEHFYQIVDSSTEKIIIQEYTTNFRQIPPL